jgi:hypothetical protein
MHSLVQKSRGKRIDLTFFSFFFPFFDPFKESICSWYSCEMGNKKECVQAIAFAIPVHSLSRRSRDVKKRDGLLQHRIKRRLVSRT